MMQRILTALLFFLGITAFGQDATINIDNGENPDSYYVYADGEYLGQNISVITLSAGSTILEITTVRLHGELTVFKEETLLSAGESRTIRLSYPGISDGEIREFEELDLYLAQNFSDRRKDRETVKKLSGILSRLSGLTSPLYSEKEIFYRSFYNRIQMRNMEQSAQTRNGIGISVNFLLSDTPRDDNGHSSQVSSSFEDRFSTQFELTYLRQLRSINPFYVALTLQYSMNNWIYWQKETETELPGYRQEHFHGAALLIGVGMNPVIRGGFSVVLETGMGNQSYFYDSSAGEFSTATGAIFGLEIYVKGGPALLIQDFLRLEMLFFYNFNSNVIEVSRGGLGFRFLFCF